MAGRFHRRREPGHRIIERARPPPSGRRRRASRRPHKRGTPPRFPPATAAEIRRRGRSKPCSRNSSISTAPTMVDQYIVSASRRPETHGPLTSDISSDQRSASPLRRLAWLCVWALTRPGIARCPRMSQSSASTAAPGGSIAPILPSSMRMSAASGTKAGALITAVFCRSSLDIRSRSGKCADAVVEPARGGQQHAVAAEAGDELSPTCPPSACTAGTTSCGSRPIEAGHTSSRVRLR